MTTAHEIEEAIRALEKTERAKLFEHLPQLFPELGGDAEWAAIIRSDQPRPGFSALVDSYMRVFRQSLTPIRRLRKAISIKARGLPRGTRVLAALPQPAFGGAVSSASRISAL
jgi:hypothetical protein